MQIVIDLKDAEKLADKLVQVNARALPYATRSAINSAAFDAQKRYRYRAKKQLTLRNRYTEQSIRVNQARGLRIEQQRSVVGSTADYMATQEFGGVETGKRGLSQPIATNAAANLAPGIRPRYKLPTKRNTRRNIELVRKYRRGGATRKQRNLVAILTAAETGKVAFINTGRVRGFFRVQGGKRGAKRARKLYKQTGSMGNLKIKMMWDLSKRSVRIPDKDLLEPSYKEAALQMPRHYHKALAFQLRRLGMY